MKLKLAFIGMGNVGRAFLRLLQSKRDELEQNHGITCVVTAIATARHGSLVSHAGLDPGDLAHGIGSGADIEAVADSEPVTDASEAIARCSADILFETTTLNPVDGEPAVTHIRSAILRGISVVTANKAPVAYAYRELSRLAADNDVMFRFEGTVMDGCPVFNLAEFCLPGARVLSLSGVLNSTSNLILTGMEKGRSMAECLLEAQRFGIAEANPDHDLDGWDAMIKIVALANVLMPGDQPVTVADRQGIKHLTEADVARALADGQAVRLVARAETSSSGTAITVRPERVPRSSVLGCVHGTSNVLIIDTDLMGEIAVVENDPGIGQTAYALLSDMMTIHQKLARSRKE